MSTDFDPRPREGSPGVFDLRIPPESAYFSGHFEGAPILAAVVQLDVLVLRQATKLWPDLSRLEKATRLRFRRPIRPGDVVELRLDRRQEEAPLPNAEAPGPTVAFEIVRGGESCSAGLLHFAGGRPP